MPLNTARCKNKSSDAHPARALPVTRELKTASVMGKSLLFMKPNMVLKKQRRKLKTFFKKKVNSKGIIFFFCFKKTNSRYWCQIPIRTETLVLVGSWAEQKVCSPGSLDISILAVGCYESLVGNLYTEIKGNQKEWIVLARCCEESTCINQGSASIVFCTAVLTLLGWTFAASILARKSVGENLNSFCR